MRTIPFASLIVPEGRQRKLFDEKKMADLAMSILTKGLMHPPVAKTNADGTYTLIAGERRTRAISKLIEGQQSFDCNAELVPAGHIPVILLSDLGTHGLKEAELEENTIRENLTWQEAAMAIAELHKLRGEQAKEAGTVHTFKATATEIKNDGTPAVGEQTTRIVEAVVIASKLDDPDIQKAKTQKEAMKILRKKAEVAHRAELAKHFDQTNTLHHLHQGNALEYLQGYAAATFDCILTDPPYGVDAHAFGSQAGTGHEYKDNWEYALNCYKVLAHEGYRITKPVATLYAFCDIRRFEELEMEFSLHGWDVWPVPLIWAKTNGMLPRPQLGPRRTYEAILMATKGNPQFHKVGAPDVIICPQREEMEHGAQKPVELYVELLSRSTMPGQTVLDPFAGSGTIFPAANRAKVTAHGVELSEEYFNLALTRMNQADQIDLSDLGI